MTQFEKFSSFSMVEFEYDCWILIDKEFRNIDGKVTEIQSCQPPDVVDSA